MRTHAQPNGADSVFRLLKAVAAHLAKGHAVSFEAIVGETRMPSVVAHNIRKTGRASPHVP